MGSPDWSVIEITPTGWNVIPAADVPVKFRRPRGMAGLPIPVTGGTIDDLRPFLNVRSEADWKLSVAWLLGALRPTDRIRSCASLTSRDGKDLTGRRLIRVADPSCPALRSEPKNPHDLAIAAESNWISRSTTFLSQTLASGACAGSAPGGFATQELSPAGGIPVRCETPGTPHRYRRSHRTQRLNDGLSMFRWFIPEAVAGRAGMDGEFDAPSPRILVPSYR
jgi:hypothetical protein